MKKKLMKEELFHKYIVRYYKVSHGIQVSWNVIVPCYHSFNSSGSRYIELLGIFPRNNMSANLQGN